MMNLFSSYGWTHDHNGKLVEVTYTPTQSFLGWLLRREPQAKHFKPSYGGCGWVECDTYRPATTLETRMCNRVRAQINRGV